MHGMAKYPEIYPLKTRLSIQLLVWHMTLIQRSNLSDAMDSIWCLNSAFCLTEFNLEFVLGILESTVCNVRSFLTFIFLKSDARTLSDILMLILQQWGILQHFRKILWHSTEFHRLEKITDHDYSATAAINSEITITLTTSNSQTEIKYSNWFASVEKCRRNWYEWKMSSCCTIICQCSTPDGRIPCKNKSGHHHLHVTRISSSLIGSIAGWLSECSSVTVTCNCTN